MYNLVIRTCIHVQEYAVINEHRVGDYPTRSDEHGVWGWDPFFLGTLNSIVREHGTANESYSYFQLMPINIKATFFCRKNELLEHGKL